MSALTNKSNISSQGLSYTVRGPAQSKFAVILVHGWCCRASDFDALVSNLTAQSLDCQMIAADLPGHGSTSTSVCPTPSVSAFATLVLDLVSELDVESAILVGHSMGLRIVVDAWAQQAQRRQVVKGLVFLDTSNYKLRAGLYSFDKSHSAEKKTDKRNDPLSNEKKNAQIMDAFKATFSENTPVTFRTATLAHVASRDIEYRERLRQSHISYDFESLEDVINDIGQSGTPILNLQSTDVNADQQRVRLKAGEKSRWMSYIEEHVPRSKQILVENSGHYPHMDRTELVASEIKDFVEYVRGMCKEME